MDNRTPILLEAATKALIAISDIGLQRALPTLTEGYGEAAAHLWERARTTGMDIDKRLEEAHNKLQEALRLFDEAQGLIEDELQPREKQNDTRVHYRKNRISRRRKSRRRC